MGAFLVVAPASAAAQTTADEEARALFRAGELAYNEAHFERAVDYFERAYALSRRPALLFNIANAHDRLRRGREALEAYERFLALVPDGTGVTFARARVAALRAELGRAERERAEQEEAPESEGAGAETSEPADASGPDDAQVSGDARAAAIALLITGGVLMAGGGVATAWWVDRIGATDRCAGVGCTNAATLGGERDAAAGTAISLFALGPAAVTAGAILVASEDQKASAGLACAPSVAPGAAGLSCMGRF